MFLTRKYVVELSISFPKISVERSGNITRQSFKNIGLGHTSAQRDMTPPRTS